MTTRRYDALSATTISGTTLCSTNVSATNIYGAGLTAVNVSATTYENISEQAVTITPTITFSVPGALTTGIKACRFLCPLAVTITKAYAVVMSAPSGADLIFDIHKNGTTIWASANRVTITDNTLSGTSTTFSSTSLADGDYLDLYIDQVGSSTAGSNATVELKTSLSVT